MKRTDAKKKFITIAVTEELSQELDYIAAQSDRSKSKVASMILKNNMYDKGAEMSLLIDLSTQLQHSKMTSAEKKRAADNIMQIMKLREGK